MKEQKAEGPDLVEVKHSQGKVMRLPPSVAGHLMRKYRWERVGGDEPKGEGRLAKPALAGPGESGRPPEMPPREPEGPAEKPARKPEGRAEGLPEERKEKPGEEKEAKRQKTISDRYLRELQEKRKTAEEIESKSLMDNVRAQVEAEMTARAGPFIEKIREDKEGLRIKREELESGEEQIGILEERAKTASQEEKKKIDEERKKINKGLESLRKEIRDIEGRKKEAEKGAGPYLEALKEYRGEEERILDEHPEWFEKEEEPVPAGGKIRRNKDGTREVEFGDLESEIQFRGRFRYKYRTIEDAVEECRAFLNEAARSCVDIRGVNHIAGGLIVEAARDFAVEAFRKKSPEAGKIKAIYEDLVWEYDGIKRLLDYWWLACEAPEGMGVGFKKAIHFGQKLTGKHMKWFWTGYRREGVLKAMGESCPELNITELKANFEKMVAKYGTEENADVNAVIGVMLRLGGGMGVFDGKEIMPVKLTGIPGVIYIEANPNLPWDTATAAFDRESAFLYEVMKNSAYYFFLYPESRHELMSLFLEPTGKYTDEGEPIYRSWLNDELFYFITAFQMKGLENFYFDNCYRVKDGKFILGPLSAERRKELGWDEKQSIEENLRNLAMFKEDELLAYAEAQGWSFQVEDARGNVREVWDKTVSREQNLEALRRLAIDELRQLPGAYWLMKKRLVSCKVWKINNWHEFRFDKFPDGNLFGAWAQGQLYTQESRYDIIGILRGQIEREGILGWIEKLETYHMCQVPNELAFIKENYLAFLRDSLSESMVVPSLRNARLAGSDIRLDLRTLLARRMILDGWRTKVRLRGCGARGVSYRNPMAFPDWLLARQALQFVSERKIMEPFLAGGGVSYEDFVHWTGLKVKETHRAVSFDGDGYFWNEFEEMSRDEWERWLTENQQAAARVSGMIKRLPAAVYWKKQEPAFEYQVEAAIAKTYARAKIAAESKRKGLRGLILSFFYTHGFPVKLTEEWQLMMRVLRRQRCGMDLRTEEERLPLIEVDGETVQPFSDKILGRYWLPQMIGFKDERLTDGTKRRIRVPIYETRHTPVMFERMDPDLLLELEYGLLPSLGEIRALDAITDVNERQRRLRELLERTAEQKMGVRATAEELKVLEELVEIVQIRDPKEARKRRRELMFKEAERKMGIDMVKHLIYFTMEGCPQSEEEFSPQFPFHITSLWFDREFTRRSGVFIRQMAENEVAQIYAETGAKIPLDEFCERFAFKKEIHNPLTTWLTLKTARNAGVIDKNEMARLCMRYQTDEDIAATYYRELAALGYEHTIRAELMAKVDDEIGRAFTAAVEELRGLAGTKSGILGLAFSGGRVAEGKRFIRNVGLSNLLLWGGNNILQVLGGGFGGPLLAGIFGLANVFILPGSFWATGAKETDHGWRYILGRSIGVMGDRRRRSHIDSIAREYGDFNLWGAVTKLWGGHPVELPLVPSTNIRIDDIVRAFANDKANLGGGLKPR